MNGALLLLIGSVCLLAAYFTYSKFIAKLIGIDPSRRTPAHEQGDGIDYVPAHPVVLYGHHFAAIAGAGPIIGPVLAAQFGWASVAIWIVLGCIFIGAMHDMMALFLSVRHQGKSIGSVIEEVLGRSGKMIFLLFCFSALVLVMAVFTGQVADAFVTSPAVATSSLLGIFEAALFGVCVYRFRWSVKWASFVFVPVLFFLVWIGMVYPCDLMTCFGSSATEYNAAAALKVIEPNHVIPEAMTAAYDSARSIWVLVLFVYCFVASTLPVWLLLQPRDYLNSYLLYAMLAIGLVAVVWIHPDLKLEAFSGFTVKNAMKGAQCGIPWKMFPLLFVTVACGACSGFHALVASGTTSKQLDNERHIRPVGYGCMLLEGVVALLALIAVASLVPQANFVPDEEAVRKGLDLSSGLNQGLYSGRPPVELFAQGLASVCEKMGLPGAASKNFMLLSVAAFLMTSVDACTRLARFIWQELWSTASSSAPSGVRPNLAVRLNKNMYFATCVVIVLGAGILFNKKMAGQLWTMFASANQMLAALTLLTASLWLFKKRLSWWIAFLPMCFMIVTSGTAVFQLFLDNVDKWMSRGFAAGGVTAIGAAMLFVLAIVLLVLGLVCLRRLIMNRMLQKLAKK